MEDRTRNILIGLIVMVGVVGLGSAILLPSLGPKVDPGTAEYAHGRRLMTEGKLDEAQRVLLEIMERHRGTPVAARAQEDKDLGIPYLQAMRLARSGEPAQASAILSRVAQEGAKSEWGVKAAQALKALGPLGALPGGPPPGPPAPMVPVAPEAARRARLEQANALLEQGRAGEARRVFEGLVQENPDDAAGKAAHLALTTLQAADDAIRTDPDVARARMALHHARASLLAYRGANGSYPATLQDRGLEQFGFSYRDLLGDVQRVESYRPEGPARFEITAVARDARGTRVRATDQSVEELP